MGRERSCSSIFRVTIARHNAVALPSTVPSLRIHYRRYNYYTSIIRGTASETSDDCRWPQPTNWTWLYFFENVSYALSRGGLIAHNWCRRLKGEAGIHPCQLGDKNTSLLFFIVVTIFPVSQTSNMFGVVKFNLWFHNNSQFSMSKNLQLKPEKIYLLFLSDTVTWSENTWVE